MCRQGVRCTSRERGRDSGPSRANPQMNGREKRPARFGARLCLAAQTFQKYQMMQNRPRHGGMLAIRNPVLFGGLLHNTGQGAVVGMAHKGAQVMDNMMVEPTRQPSYQRVAGRIVGRSREDVIDAVVELAAAGGKVSAVHGVSGLEYERHRQTDDYVSQHERQSDQQEWFP